MTFGDFVLSFISNFLATGLVGAGLYLLLEYRFNIKEKRKEELFEMMSKEKKTITYLEIIRREILDIDIAVKNYLELPTGYHPKVNVNLEISFWEVLKTGGEIPILIEPTTLQVLTHYYAVASEVNLIFSRPDEYGNKYTKQTFSELLVGKLKDVESMNRNDQILKLIDECIEQAHKSSSSFERLFDKLK